MRQKSLQLAAGLRRWALDCWRIDASVLGQLRAFEEGGFLDLRRAKVHPPLMLAIRLDRLPCMGA
jgi:hypothetical protein